MIYEFWNVNIVQMPKFIMMFNMTLLRMLDSNAKNVH